MDQKKHSRYQIGQRIRKERHLRHISQETLASDLDVSANYIGDIERGKRPVSLNMAEKLCQYFHLTLDYLYRGLTPKNPAVHMLQESDPLRELFELLDSCNEEELQLCLNMIRSLLSCWRSAHK